MTEIIDKEYYDGLIAEERYEAGMYKCLYELWEKRATEYQAKIIDLIEVLRAVNEIDANGYAVARMNRNLRDRIEAVLGDVGGSGK